MLDVVKGAETLKLVIGNLWLTQCHLEPAASVWAEADSCVWGVLARWAMLVKYLHAHQFSSCQGLLPGEVCLL